VANTVAVDQPRLLSGAKIGARFGLTFDRLSGPFSFEAHQDFKCRQALAGGAGSIHVGMTIDIILSIMYLTLHNA